MSKRYLNSRSITKLLEEAEIIDRFDAKVTNIQFGKTAFSPIAAIFTDIKYPNIFNDIRKKDYDFHQAALDFIVKNKTFDARINLESGSDIYIYKNEGIHVEVVPCSNSNHMRPNFQYAYLRTGNSN